MWSRYHPVSPWPERDDELRTLLSIYRGSRAMAAKAMKLSRFAVTGRAHRLGLPPIDPSLKPTPRPPAPPSPLDPPWNSPLRDRWCHMLPLGYPTLPPLPSLQPGQHEHGQHGGGPHQEPHA